MKRPRSKADKQARLQRILGILDDLYPNVTCALHHSNPWELLVATILSAQCTDERVNQVTPALFARCPDAATMAAASIEDLERLVQPTGFYRQKARNIQLDP